MNLDPEKEVICQNHICKKTFKLKDSLPSLSAYSDIRCPYCRSTNNEHNTEYRKEIFGHK